MINCRDSKSSNSAIIIAKDVLHIAWRLAAGGYMPGDIWQSSEGSGQNRPAWCRRAAKEPQIARMSLARTTCSAGNPCIHVSVRHPANRA